MPEGFKTFHYGSRRIMRNISPQELVILISKYLDTEKLIGENPSVTREMIDTLGETEGQAFIIQ